MLLGLLPFIGLILTIISLKNKFNSYDSIIAGSVLWALFVFITTAILSIFKLLTYNTILTLWCAYCVIFLYTAKVKIYNLDLSFYKNKNYYLIALIIISLTTLVIGILYPPNTWDSMTYHMPKVMHWIQNNCQDHYFTNIIRQNGLAPFAETIILHTMILSKSDLFSTLIQWFAFIGSLLTIASITNQLGGSKKACLFATTFFATLPMAILQASSTQTDLVVTFWILAFISSFLHWKENQNYFNAICAACSLGFAIYTKGTAYVIAFPFVLYFAYLILKNFRTKIFQGFLIALIVITINTPHLLKNYNYYQHIFASATGTISKLTLKAFAFNVTGNILTNIDPKAMQILDSTYKKINTFLEFNDKNSTIIPAGMNIHALRTHEDVAPNMLHMCLLLTMFMFLFIRRQVFPLPFTFLALASLLSFCALIAFQTWITRLQVPIFAIFSPIFGIFLSKINLRINYAKEIIIGILLFYMLIPLLLNRPRPLFPYYFKMGILNNTREELYFSNRPNLIKEYVGALDILSIKKPRNIGLLTMGDSWEYPIWVMLEKRLGYIPKIQHITEKDVQDKTFQFIIALDQALNNKAKHEIINVFERTNNGYISILENN